MKRSQAEALAGLVLLFDPEGGILRINLGNPIHHAIMAAAAIGFGVCTYVRESRKGSD